MIIKKIKNYINKRSWIDTQLHQPVIFISQLSRSGGSLLSSLFDNVPEIFAFPKEVKFGAIKKTLPDLKSFCNELPEEILMRFINENGIFKDAMRGDYKKGTKAAVPFEFERAQFESTFYRLWRENTPTTGRELMTIFFTAFFSSWTNYPKHSIECKQFISGFASWTAMDPKNIERFFGYYSDGFLIQIVRDPVSWYESVSARNLQKTSLKRKELFPIYAGIDAAISSYEQQWNITQNYMKTYGDKLLLLNFDSLINNRERTMRRVSERLGIAYSDSMLIPSFAGRKIEGNSSFNDRYKKHVDRNTILDSKEKIQLEEKLNPIYEQVEKLSL